MISEDLILRTPLIPYADGIYLKPENLQRFGSYKIRGIVGALKTATHEQIKFGLSAASAGNMAQAVAFAAHLLEIPCRIFVPDTAPDVKKQAIRDLGAEVIELPYEEVWKYVNGEMRPQGKEFFIHPVFTPGLKEGYGSISDEIYEDLPEIDTVIVPFGVGGLSLGIAARIRAIHPKARVYACEPETATPLAASLKKGSPQSIHRIPSFVDAAGAPEVLPAVYAKASQMIAGSIVVSLEDIRNSMQTLLFRHKLLCEGSAALSLAAAIQLQREKKGQRAVCVLTGGNISASLFSEVFSGGHSPSHV